MTVARFNLIFEGEIEAGFDQTSVRSALELLFKFDAEGQAQLFSGQAIVLGESMDAATANSFKQALAGAGAATGAAAGADGGTGAAAGAGTA